MSLYEKIAIFLSTIAILIPIIQWIWKRWVVKTDLYFNPTGRAMLFFNQSGSYIRIDGVYEAENKPTTVKKIAVKVTSQKDEKKQNLTWSSFISPITQSLVGNYMQTTESAHPFRIDADSVSCAFTEFSDPFDSFGKVFRNCTSALFSKIPDIKKNNSKYIDAKSAYTSLSEYATAKQLLESEFFWKIGKYDIDICVNYGTKEKHFLYSVTVGEHEYEHLKANIDESLLSPLKRCYNVQWNYYTAIVELQFGEKQRK